MGIESSRKRFLILIALVFAPAFAWGGSLQPARAETAGELIQQGKEQLFSGTIQGILDAHQTFSRAQDNYGQRCTSFLPLVGDCTVQQAREKALIHGYLALTRLLDLMVRNDGDAVDALPELMELFGFTVVGDHFDTLEADLPIGYGGYPALPASSPGSEDVRAFLAGSVLEALEASILDMDEVIYYCGVADQYGIDTTEVLEARLTGAERDIQVDEGDYHLMRAGLKTARAFILIATAWNLDVDIRDTAAVMNLGIFNPKEFLERYPDLLNLLSSDGTPSHDGAGALAQAKDSLIGAVDDYMIASEKIRDDAGTPVGVEAFIEIGPCDLQREELFREMIAELKASLKNGAPVEITLAEETWVFIDGATEDEIEVRLYDNMAEGGFHGLSGCDFIGCGGRVECVVVDGDAITLEFVSSGPMHWSRAVLTGTLDREKGAISNGTYSGDRETGSFEGTFTARRDSVEHKTIGFDPNPFFGHPDAGGPFNLRDFLPRFTSCGEPLYDTVGYGLDPKDPDATLGGILPGMTQEEWGLDFWPEQIVEIPEWPGHWGEIPPVFVDLIGDNNPAVPGSDIHEVYLAKDAENLYVRMTLADGPPNQAPMPEDPYSAMHYVVQLRPGHDRFHGVPYAGAVYRQGQGWQAFIHRSDQGGVTVLHTSSEVQTGDDFLQWSIPLAHLGPLTGKYVAAWTHWTPGWTRPSDFNETCIRIGPLTSISGTAAIPAFDGDGPVYASVFHHHGTLEASKETLIGRVTVYPDEISDGTASFTFTGLPAGAEVFVAARWDADYNGIRSPGDYVARSAPLTVAGDGSSSVDLALRTIYAKGEEGPPFFEWANVMEHHTPDGVYTAVAAVLRDPLGTVPHTIQSLTVSGPGDFSYTFSGADFLGPQRAYYGEIPGSPPDGEYTFMAVNNNGNQAKAYYRLTKGESIPVPADGTLQASGDPLAPALSWGGLPEYHGNLFYRARIFDAASGLIVWTSTPGPDTWVQVPQGILSRDSRYVWRVEVFDQHTYIVSNKRAVSRSIPLSMDNTRPFFTSALVYALPEEHGLRSAIAVWVRDPNGSVPESIQSIIVTDPEGNILPAMEHGDYLPPWDMFWAVFDGGPTPGVYRFEVTDIEGKTAITHDYVDGSTVPVVDVETIQASGGDGLPLLISWAAPDGMEGPLYFRALIEDEQVNRVWGSGFITETAVTVPHNVTLEQGVSYRLQVRALDYRYWGHHNAESRSGKKPLILDNSSPYFRWAGVYVYEDQGGIFTGLDASIHHPNAPVPDGIVSLTVEGPGGFSLDMLNHPSLYFDPQFNGFWVRVQGKLAPGVYTFTVTDRTGGSAVSRDWMGDAPVPPLVDSSTIQVTGDPMAPVVSWEGVSGYGARPYYRVRLYDDGGNTLYRSGREPQTFQSIPRGIIEPGELYQVRVETQDHLHWVTYNARSNSLYALWTASEHPAMPVISGRVTGPDGVPIKGLLVLAFDQPCGGHLVGWTFTGDGGEYHMHIEGGQAYIRTDSRHNHMPYKDRWFDWSGGTENCAHAALLILPGTLELTGIDLYLESFAIEDAIEALKALVGVPVDGRPVLDPDGDGRIGMEDAIIILQHLGGLRQPTS